MKVSIIVPIYNCEKYVLRCLESIAAQDYPDIECILVDDCSTDASMACIKNFLSSHDGHVAFVVKSHDCNRGAAAARNTGVDAATGDYISFVDSDDALVQHSVSIMVALAEKYHGVDLVQGACHFTLPDDFPAGTALHGLSSLRNIEFCDTTGFLFDLMMTYRLPVAPWNKLIRRGILKRTTMRFDEGLRRFEDWLWSYRLCVESKSVAFAHAYLYKYNVLVEGGLTQSSSIQDGARTWRDIFSRVIGQGVPPFHSAKAAYRMIGIWFVQHNVVPGLFDDINDEFADWVRACGLHVPSMLLILRGRVKSHVLRRGLDGLLYRVCSSHFVHPLV